MIGLLCIVFVVLPYTLSRILARIAEIKSQASVFGGEDHVLLWSPDHHIGEFVREYFFEVPLPPSFYSFSLSLWSSH